MIADPLPIVPLPGPVDAVVQVPGSKSYTNRALIVSALAQGRSVLSGGLFSDDTDRMADSLRRQGLRVEEDRPDARFEVWGEGGRIPEREAELFAGNSGTAARFLTAVLALGRGRYVVDGDARMRQRPIRPLLGALASLGVRVRSVGETGCPPVVIDSDGLPGGRVSMPGDSSSQYFSALMMVAPLTTLGLVLEVEGELVSRPYIDLTADLMSAFGARMERDAHYRILTVPGGQQYQAREYSIEPDASNASYFFAGAAITGGRVRVDHLGRNSAQGDLKLVDVFEAMGCRVTRGDDFIEIQGPPTGTLRGVSVDANEFSDMAQTLYALAPFADGATEVRNVAHSRLQECDRIAASAAELRRLGQEVTEFRDGLRIEPRPITPAVIHTYSDHRMAMAFALVGLRAPGIAIADPGCTAKTFPGYWDELERLRDRTKDCHA